MCRPPTQSFGILLLAQASQLSHVTLEDILLHCFTSVFVIRSWLEHSLTLTKLAFASKQATMRNSEREADKQRMFERLVATRSAAAKLRVLWIRRVLLLQLGPYFISYISTKQNLNAIFYLLDFKPQRFLLIVVSWLHIYFKVYCFKRLY